MRNIWEYMITAESHFPMITSTSVIGDVVSSSIVPLRFSSANRRIVIKGMKNNPITLTLASSGRNTCSLMFIGNCSPSSVASMAMFTK